LKTEFVANAFEFEMGQAGIITF